MAQYVVSLVKFVGVLLGAVGSTIGGWIAYSAFVVDHDVPIGPAIDGQRKTYMSPRAGMLSYYVDEQAAGAGRPLLLVHSINAAGNAYEMRDIFERYRGQRPVYALDLPGFGFSDRSDRVYTKELYQDAILDFVENVVERPVDVVALSLGSEFAATAAQRRPDLFVSLVMIGPSGFASRETKTRGERDSESANTTDRVYNFLRTPLWSQAIYDLLATKPLIRYFLKMSFYGDPDEALVDYSWLASHQPGARYAPLYFVSGKLFDPHVFEDVYAQIDLPIVVYFSEGGFVSFDRLPEIVEMKPNWQSRRIPETAGLPQFEKMDELADALNEFWATNNLVSSAAD